MKRTVTKSQGCVGNVLPLQHLRSSDLRLSPNLVRR
jgi:hypothetical protein